MAPLHKTAPSSLIGLASYDNQTSENCKSAQIALFIWNSGWCSNAQTGLIGSTRKNGRLAW